MPSKPLSPCAHPGCHRLVKRGRCDEHHVKQSDRRKHSAEQRKFYSSRRWRLLSEMVRREQPICEMCGERLSRVCDHINQNFRDCRRENLRALCLECNASLTGKQHQRKSRGADA